MKILTNKHFLLLFYLMLFSFPKAKAANEPLASVDVSVDTCTIGDNILYTLRVLHDPNVSIAYPTEADSIFSPFEIRKLERESQAEDELVHDELRYTLTIFETGLHHVPPIILQYLKDETDAKEAKLQVPAKPIYVRSVLDSTQKNIADIKPVRTPSIPIWIYMAVLAAILLIALAAYLIYKARNRQKPAEVAKPKPQKPAYEEVMEKLSALKAYPLETELHYKNYYTDLSIALRIFLERFYKIPAQEQLTGEIHAAMRRAALVEPAENTKQILEKADFVKFAKYYPSRLEAEESLQLALKVVEAGKPSLQPETETSTTSEEK